MEFMILGFMCGVKDIGSDVFIREGVDIVIICYWKEMVSCLIR